MKPHKHAEYVKAFCDGKTVQYRLPCDHSQWGQVTKFQHFDFYDVYRIKPAEKVVRWLWARKDMHGTWIPTSCYLTEDEFRHATPEGREYKKLEWSREEFDE